MSVQLTKNILCEIFDSPHPETQESFISAGVIKAPSMPESGCNEALVVPKFTTKSEIQPDMICLMAICHKVGMECGWIITEKNHFFAKSVQCHYEQNFCFDARNLKHLYINSKNSVDFSIHTDHFVYHTNIYNVPFALNFDELNPLSNFIHWAYKNRLDLEIMPIIITPSGGIHIAFTQYNSSCKNWINFAKDIFSDNLGTVESDRLELEPQFLGTKPSMTQGGKLGRKTTSKEA